MIPNQAKDPTGFALYISNVTRAFANGETIESKMAQENDDGWSVEPDPTWNWYRTDYRIRQPKKPSINWHEVHPDFNVLAVDYSGLGILSNADLEVVGSSWLAKQPCKETVRITYANSFASFKPGDCAWQDSLVTRPGWVLQTNGEVK